jgi:hypothetical protein
MSPQNNMKKILLIAAIFAIPFLVSAQDSTIKSVPVYAFAGVPSAGTSEVDTLTIQTSTSAGTFTIAIAGGRTTVPITWSATNTTLINAVDAALEAIPIIGVGGVTTAAGTLTAGIGTITLTFTGKNAKRDMPALSIGTNLLTGGTAPTLTTTTPGVDATFRDAPTGTLLVDSVTPDLYINDSLTAGAPTWTKVSP